MQAAKPVSILLVEDQELIRQGIAALLGAVPGVIVTGQAGDGLQAVRQASKLEPDVVLMDLSMPIMDGVEATGEIKKRRPFIRVLALTVADCEKKVADVLRAGADGYALKQAGRDDLVAAINSVMRGERYLGAGLSRSMVERYLAAPPEANPLALLTPRERQVLKLIAQGHRNRDVAEQLFISIKTVDSHRTNIMQKLDLHNAAELATFAIRAGLVNA
ncbi:response regulator transcription factor [Telmatospirillum sp. J64-1]|uniref:response regulator n=1 Tax=Telmatospirillum sp. J64-1 TaxID=2502183 RepID=UPI00115E12A1|nr:response regulator transcription factor [Telmatospirillum sp. J64-1]